MLKNHNDILKKKKNKYVWALSQETSPHWEENRTHATQCLNHRKQMVLHHHSTVGCGGHKRCGCSPSVLGMVLLCLASLTQVESRCWGWRPKPPGFEVSKINLQQNSIACQP